MPDEHVLLRRYTPGPHRLHKMHPRPGQTVTVPLLDQDGTEIEWIDVIGRDADVVALVASGLYGKVLSGAWSPRNELIEVTACASPGFVLRRDADTVLDSLTREYLRPFLVAHGVSPSDAGQVRVVVERDADA